MLTPKKIIDLKLINYFPNIIEENEKEELDLTTKKDKLKTISQTKIKIKALTEPKIKISTGDYIFSDNVVSEESIISSESKINDHNSSLIINQKNNKINLKNKKKKYDLNRERYSVISIQEKNKNKKFNRRKTYWSILKEIEQNKNHIEETKNQYVNPIDHMYSRYSVNLKEYLYKNKDDLKLLGSKIYKKKPFDEICKDFDSVEKQILTPIPKKYGIKNKFEKNESYNFERSAVVLRRVDYALRLSNGNWNKLSNENLQDGFGRTISETENYVIRNSCIIIQNWWKSKYKEIVIKNKNLLRDFKRFFVNSRKRINLKIKRNSNFCSNLECIFIKKIENKVLRNAKCKNLSLEKKTNRINSIKNLKINENKRILNLPKKIQNIPIFTKSIKIDIINKIIKIQKNVKLFLNKEFKKNKNEVIEKNYTTNNIIDSVCIKKNTVNFNIKEISFSLHCISTLTSNKNKTNTNTREIMIPVFITKEILNKRFIKQIIQIQKKIKSFLKYIKLKKTKKTLALKFLKCDLCSCKIKLNCDCECHDKYSEPLQNNSFYSLNSNNNDEF